MTLPRTRPAALLDERATADGELVAALRALNLAGERFRQAVAAHYDVSLSETVAMSHLSNHGPVTPRQLADLVGLTPSTVTSLLDRLESANLAVRAPHPTDRRKSVVSVTARGQQLLGSVQKWMTEATKVIEPAQASVAAAILTDLAQGLHQQADVITDGGA